MIGRAVVGFVVMMMVMRRRERGRGEREHAAEEE
jgi:hypothetical protein